MGVVLFGLAGWAQAQTTVNIHAISVDLPKSPYLGKEVTTTGIVISVLSDGFYIENQSNWDSNTCSSEGIYVYTPTITPSSFVALKDSVTVTGLVEASNSSSYAGVQIYIAVPVLASNIIVNSTGNTLPTTVSSSTLTSATSGTCSDYGTDTFGQWLPFEGMRVNIPSSSSLLVTQGTGGTLDTTTQTAITNGRFWAVFTTTRPFRSTGISDLDTVPSTAPSTVSRWSGNPQLLLVDTTALGGTALNASATTEYTGSADLVGIIDYHVSSQGYTGLLLDADSVSALSKQGGATPTAAAARTTGQITLATQDLESSAGIGLSAGETSRITKLANAIVNYEHSPDILALQGITPATLTLLESAISSAGGPAYSDLSAASTADASSYVNVFLVDTAKFDNPVAAQALSSATYTTTVNTTATLFDRAPLLLTAGIPRTGTTDYNIVVVNTTLLKRTNIDDTTLGADARNRREQQAQALAGLFEPYEEDGDHLFVAGGYDSFEFSDGYVDTLGIMDGSEATNTSSGTLVTLYDATYNTTALDNTTTVSTNQSTGVTNAATDRYSYVESGSAEQTDHILISAEMAGLAAIDYARFGADFPVSETYDTSTVERASSHDGVVAYLTVPYPSSTKIISSLNPSYYGNSITFTATVSSAGGTPTGTVTFYDGSTELGTGTLTAGVATYTTSTLTIGTHTIKASYGGSTVFDTSSATLSQIVNADVTTLDLTTSGTPSYYGSSVTFTVLASSTDITPTGSVIFVDTSNNAATLGTVKLTSGTASLSSSTLAVGTHLIEVTYGGDTNNGSANSNIVTQVVETVDATGSTLVCLPNPAAYAALVTCTDKVASSAGTPTGNVTFYDGTTSLGTVVLSAGQVTYTTSSLSVGSHTLTAVYAGAGAYQTSTSNTVTEIILSNFTLTATPASHTVYTGEAATYTVTVTPGTGFTLDVALTCAGLPANTTCTLTPSTVTGGSGTSKLVVQTTAPSQTTASARSGARAWPLLAGILLLLLPRRWRCGRGWLTTLLLIAALAVGAITGSIAGCGGSRALTGGSPVGSYTVTVTGVATDGSIALTQKTTVAVKIESLF
jgi:hypothetical protein